jgi:acyl-CoA thioester hydrolase
MTVPDPSRSDTAAPDTAAPDTAPPFVWPLRVYWEDTDAGGVVFYANYLKFFERARTEWLRGLGFSQERLRLDTGVMFVVTDTAVRYRQPARLDDRLQVSVRIVEQGRASLVIDQQARRDGTLLAEGRIRIGCVDAQRFTPCRLPNVILERLNAA